MDSGPLRLLPALLAWGCVSLAPYEEVRSRLPVESLISVDGRPVHVAQRGAGEPLVLLHGFGGSTYSWRLVVPQLSERYRVVAMDLNGFGYSERPRSLTEYTVQGQLATVLAVLGSLGIERAHVAGHSYGGALALHLAHRHPERLLSLILIDSAGPEYPRIRRYPLAGVPPLITPLMRTLGLRRDRIGERLRASVADDSVVTDELLDAYLDRLRIEGAVRAYRGLSAPGLEDAGPVPYAELDLPVLVVWGAEDDLIAPQQGREAALQMPRSQFVVLDSVGHLPMEESPAELAREMLRFLGRL